MARPKPDARKSAEFTSVVYPGNLDVEATLKSPEDKLDRVHRLKKEIWSF